MEALVHPLGCGWKVGKISEVLRVSDQKGFRVLKAAGVDVWELDKLLRFFILEKFYFLVAVVLHMGLRSLRCLKLLRLLCKVLLRQRSVV